MALTPDEIDALPTYTSAQHLKMWQRADIELAQAGVSYAVQGRTLTRNDADKVRAQINYWAEQVASESAGEAGSGNVLVRFGQEQ